MEVVIILIFALVAFWLFFFVVKRVLRMAIRLAVAGAILFALLAGAVAWWWYSPLDATPNRNRNTPARPARSPR